MFQVQPTSGATLPKSHQWQSVDVSSPAFVRRLCASILGASLHILNRVVADVSKVGLEPSTNCRWWDSGEKHPSCRLDLNHPPTAVGGIEERCSRSQLTDF
jgi:hypothetical protein